MYVLRRMMKRFTTWRTPLNTLISQWHSCPSIKELHLLVRNTAIETMTAQRMSSPITMSSQPHQGGILQHFLLWPSLASISILSLVGRGLCSCSYLCSSTTFPVLKAVSMFPISFSYAMINEVIYVQLIWKEDGVQIWYHIFMKTKVSRPLVKKTQVGTSSPVHSTQVSGVHHEYTWGLDWPDPTQLAVYGSSLY